MRLEGWIRFVESILPDIEITRGNWILSCTLGAGIAAGTSMVAVTKIESMGALSWSIVLFGVGIGLLQWAVLRRFVDFGWWLVTTALGAVPALVIAMNFRKLLRQETPIDQPDFIMLAVVIVTVGLIFAAGVAVMQYLALRVRFTTTKSWIGRGVVGWWLGSMGGMIVALGISYLVQHFIERLDAYEQVSPVATAAWPVAIGGALAGAIAGLISWEGLQSLLKDSSILLGRLLSQRKLG
jgi:hypothetical protein